MHIPLVISILALLAFALLPVLDRSANAKISAPGHVLTGSASHVGRRGKPTYSAPARHLYFHGDDDIISPIHANPWFGTDQV